MTAQGVASWTEIADGTLCGRDPDEIGVPARWALDGTEDERQGFSQSREKGGEGVRVLGHVAGADSRTPAAI